MKYFAAIYYQLSTLITDARPQVPTTFNRLTLPIPFRREKARKVTTTEVRAWRNLTSSVW